MASEMDAIGYARVTDPLKVTAVAALLARCCASADPFIRQGRGAVRLQDLDDPFQCLAGAAFELGHPAGNACPPERRRVRPRRVSASPTFHIYPTVARQLPIEGGDAARVPPPQLPLQAPLALGRIPVRPATTDQSATSRAPPAPAAP